MTVKTVLFGNMKIPNSKEDIKVELKRCKGRFLVTPTRYLQCRIDYLEYALDDFRGMQNANDI